MDVSLERSTRCRVIEIVARELSRAIMNRSLPGNLEIIESDWPVVAVTFLHIEKNLEFRTGYLSVEFNITADQKSVEAILSGYVSMVENNSEKIEFSDLDISTCQEELDKKTVADYIDFLMHDALERKMEELAKEHHDLGALMNRRYTG